MEIVEGLDEPNLTALVEQFYAQVRVDPVLGPVFNKAIADWPAHLRKLSAFWSSVMLGSGRYKGQPVPAHMRHRAEIDPAMFERWLGLWESSAQVCLPPPAASAVVAKARLIASSLRMMLFPLPLRDVAVSRS